ncbi:PLDc N-terminal domain-containing protein [Stutzerimonas azotifigens]|uniref:Cardiolipin synthase N-terminal domain-containing protein n=1 Tax=Stutzerimonas azotifigens TaxID=291995 RepID=A0ABR5YY34_9GAMM|nr:PLDc N-terminal domain-containing protein [Stutzerimonas azotifigens]MBA1272857.1 hypothetical protein [Stutzerimonas azotifigens]
MDTLSTVLMVLVAILDVVALFFVLRSGIEPGRKLVWSVVIIVLPVVGIIMWAWAAGPLGKVRL